MGRRGGFGGAGPGTGTDLGAGADAGTSGTFGGGHGGDLSELAHRSGGFGGFGGQAGIGRMFASTLGGQISWLLPFAAIALVGTLILIGRRPRTDLARASVMLWGGWLLLEFLVLSFQQGIQHSYYTSAMAPPTAALTGIGAVVFYQAYRRSGRWSLVPPLAIAVTGAWAFVLLRRTPGWNPWLPWTVAGATVVAVLALAFGWRHARRSADGLSSGRNLRGQQSAGQADGRGRRVAAGRHSRLLALAGVAGLIAVLAGPAAYAATPLSRTIEGTNPVAGPTADGASGGLGGFAGDLGHFADLGRARTGYGGGLGAGSGRTGSRPTAFGQDGAGRDAAGLGGSAVRIGGGLGGPVSKQLIAYLEAHRDGATWLVAVQGSSPAAAVILQTGGIPVMAMGGFTGNDPAPTVAQLQQYVKQGKLHYIMTGGRGGFGGSGGTVASVTSWVERSCTAVPASAYGGSATSASASTTARAVAATVTETLYHCR